MTSNCGRSVVYPIALCVQGNNKIGNNPVCNAEAGLHTRFFVFKMTDKTHDIIKRVNELIEPVLEGIGIELVDIEYLSTQGKWVLRITIDREGGVTIDDCARVSREIGDLIDIKEIIGHEYNLEVSSPGLNRPLKKEKDLIRALGKKIKVKTETPLNGRRNFKGVLQAFKGGDLHLEIDNQPMVLSWSDVEKANLVYEFDD